MNRPMSETMRGFKEQRERLVTLMEERRKEAEEKRIEEAELASTVELERAKSLLRAATEYKNGTRVYPSFGLQKAAADVEVSELVRQLNIVRTVRRSAEKALKNYEKELEALTAGYHAYNQEMKVELSLTTTPDSRHSQGGRG